MSRIAIAVITVVFAIPAFLLSRVIWPDPPGAAAPPPELLPFLIVPAIFEALAFGAGIAFLIAGGRLLARAGQPRWLTWATYLAVAWSLISWWPHSNSHRVSTSFQTLVVIDWVFHLTLILGAAVAAIFVVRVIRAGAAAADGSRSSGAAVAGVGTA